MLTLDIANHVAGVIQIKICGAVPEKFINLCVAHHINLWNIKRENGYVLAHLYLRDLLRVRPFARKTCSRLYIVGRAGLPFCYKRLKRRKMLAAGAALFCLLLYILSSFIWFVDVQGETTIPRQVIYNAATQAGLRPGVWKNNIAVKQVERYLIATIPELAWSGVHLEGTRAVIEVAEKKLPPAVDKAPADLVADKDGLITQVIVFAGTPLVKAGDTVKKGDVLIKGMTVSPVTPATPVPAEVAPVPPSRPVRAQGIVRARIWYEGYGEAAVRRTVYQRTGNRQVSLFIRIGAWQTLLQGITPLDPNKSYETVVLEKKLPGWRNNLITVESKLIINHELSTHAVEITPEEAREEAKAAALRVVQEQIPENAGVIARTIENIPLNEPDLVRVKVRIETVEEIGRAVNTVS